MRVSLNRTRSFDLNSFSFSSFFIIRVFILIEDSNEGKYVLIPLVNNVNSCVEKILSWHVISLQSKGKWPAHTLRKLKKLGSSWAYKVVRIYFVIKDLIRKHAPQRIKSVLLVWLIMIKWIYRALDNTKFIPERSY